jgi:hypothetical protein
MKLKSDYVPGQRTSRRVEFLSNNSEIATHWHFFISSNIYQFLAAYNVGHDIAVHTYMTTLTNESGRPGALSLRILGTRS